MDTKFILMVVVVIVLGMLVANMFKEVCGCKNLIEGAASPPPPTVTTAASPLNDEGCLHNLQGTGAAAGMYTAVSTASATLTVAQVQDAFQYSTITDADAQQMVTKLAADTTEAGAYPETWCNTHLPEGARSQYGSACLYKCTPDTLTRENLSFCTICCQSQEEQQHEQHELGELAIQR